MPPLQQIVVWISLLISSFVNKVPTAIGSSPVGTDKDPARVLSIAQDLVEVVYDPKEAPAFRGPYARAQTLVLLTTVMGYESGFQQAIEDGNLKGDSGSSVCFGQLNIGKGKTPEGYTQKDLVGAKNRKNCIRASLRVLRASVGSCWKYGELAALRLYGSGSCEKHIQGSADRVGTATYFRQRHKPPFTDLEVLSPKPYVAPDFISVEHKQTLTWRTVTLFY
jgi:hypothetical protein